MPSQDELYGTIHVLVNPDPAIERHLQFVDDLKADGYRFVTFKYLTRDEVSTN